MATEQEKWCAETPHVLVTAIMTLHNQRRSEWPARLALCHELIAAGADLHDAHWRMQPLAAAVALGYVEMAQLLLAHGADVHGGRRYATPLAAAAGDAELTALLQAHGAQTTAFSAAACGDVTGLAAALPDLPQGVLQRDEDDRSLLHTAARRLQTDTVRWLIAAGADVDAIAQACRDTRPLHDAARHAKGNSAILAALLDAGADVNAVDAGGVGALHMAVRDRNVDAVALLLTHGADPDAEDHGRRSTPLRRAVADTGRGGSGGKTAAALRIVELLLAHGADPAHINRSGKPLLASARSEPVRERLRAAIG
jgi:ankyrin repeat protein